MRRPIAHRGLHDFANGVVENSATAFQRAVDADFAIECDLQLSGDNVPIVFHDDALERLTGQIGNVRDLSAGQMTHIELAGSSNGDRPMRFSELLHQVDSRVALAVELKQQHDGRNAQLAEAAVAALKGYHGPIALISFSPELLVFARKFGFKGPTGIIVEQFTSDAARKNNSDWQRFYLRHLLHYPFTRFDFMDCHHMAFNLPAVKLLRAFGMKTATWTIRSQEEADAARAHCDQITFEGFMPNSD